MCTPGNSNSCPFSRVEGSRCLDLLAGTPGATTPPPMTIERASLPFELEDAYFWPDISPGTSAFVHKLAVRRAWAKKGVSARLLAYGVARARALGRTHLRLDCVADRQGLRRLYDGLGFVLHSVVQKGDSMFARYEFPTAMASASGHEPLSGQPFDADGPQGSPSA